MAATDGVFNNKHHPWPYVEVHDISPRPIPPLTRKGLHRPIFVIKAASGKPGELYFGNYDYLARIFGEESFDENNPKFCNHQTIFFKEGLAANGIGYAVRAVDPAARRASIVIEATLTPTNVTQYQKDGLGNVIYNPQTNLPIPELDGSNNIVTQPGYSMTFSSRFLTNNETYKSVQKQSQPGGVVKYPIYAAVMDSQGERGNRFGNRLYYTPDYETNTVANIQSVLYQFEPVFKPLGSDIPGPIYDQIANQASVQVSLKDRAIDQSTSVNYAWESILQNRYTETSNDVGFGSLAVSTIPLDYHVYSNSLEEIGQAILDRSPELSALDITPFMVNVLTGRSLNDQPYYDHYVVTNASDYFHPERVIYLTNGSDGDTSEAMYESICRQFYDGTLNPRIENPFKYDFTHLYDSGYTLTTKKSMYKMLSLRDDIGIDSNCQDVVNNEENDAFEDLSTGLALRAEALLRPESIFFGTPCCRVSIYQQCGTMITRPNWPYPIPANIDRLIKRGQFESSFYRKGVPKERPNSEVTRFKHLNWTPDTSQQRETSWNGGLNYIMDADTNVLIYPDLRTVYTLDNSVLSSDVFRDVIIYSKRLIRDAWTWYVGSERPSNQVNADIVNRITTTISEAFLGQIGVSVTVESLANYEALGWRKRIKVKLLGVIPGRVWDVEVLVDRAPTAAAA